MPVRINSRLVPQLSDLQLYQNTEGVCFALFLSDGFSIRQELLHILYKYIVAVFHRRLLKFALGELKNCPKLIVGLQQSGCRHPEMVATAALLSPGRDLPLTGRTSTFAVP